MLDLLWWAAIGLLLALCVTQWLGFDGSKPIAVLQSLTVHALACAGPLAVLAALAGRWAIAALCVAPLATLTWLVLPVVRGVDIVDAPGHRFTVAFGNLLASNARPADAVAAMTATGADLLVMVEYTPPMHAALHALADHEYPHRVEDVRPNPAGIALWSRLPVHGGVVEIVGRPSIDATIDVMGRSVRLLAVHTTPPTMRARLWRDELRSIGDAAATTDGPTLLIGDFNAARWHPSFRALLRRGWRSGHEVLGSGWTASWPTRGYPAPPFVRIDHALVDRHLWPLAVREVDIPGSDHRAFVMTFVVPPTVSGR